MKKGIVALILAVIFCTTANAQAGGNYDRRQAKMQEMMRSPEERAAKQTHKMARKLRLTEAQEKAVYDANLAKATQMQPMIDQMRTAKHKRKAIQADYDARLRETLTTDQYAQLEDMKAARRARRMQRMDRYDAPRNDGYQPARDGMPTR